MLPQPPAAPAARLADTFGAFVGALLGGFLRGKDRAALAAAWAWLVAAFLPSLTRPARPAPLPPVPPASPAPVIQAVPTPELAAPPVAAFAPVQVACSAAAVEFQVVTDAPAPAPRMTPLPLVYLFSRPGSDTSMSIAPASAPSVGIPPAVPAPAETPPARKRRSAGKPKAAPKAGRRKTEAASAPDAPLDPPARGRGRKAK